MPLGGAYEQTRTNIAAESCRHPPQASPPPLPLPPQSIVRNEYKIFTTVRQEKGQDISGACGQLALEKANSKPTPSAQQLVGQQRTQQQQQQQQQEQQRQQREEQEGSVPPASAGHCSSACSCEGEGGEGGGKCGGGAPGRSGSGEGGGTACSMEGAAGGAKEWGSDEGSMVSASSGVELRDIEEL